MKSALQLRCLALMTISAAALLLHGCASGRPGAALEFQTGESVVLAGEIPGQLAFAPLLSRRVAVRNTYLDRLPRTLHYRPGRDYVLDPSGTIRRTANSRIPDFATNILYGKEDFLHTKFPGYGNNAFFVYVDYYHGQRWERPSVQQQLGAARLPRTVKKLEAGERVHVVAFGDSITFGGEASEPALIFWERWVGTLRHKYPRTTIEVTNGATGGDNTLHGLQRLEAKVLAQHPDLVLVAFGMNDHNQNSVAPDRFARNLRAIIERVRACGAEVVLLSAFPPNPKWHCGSHQMEAYAEATEKVAREERCAYADVYHLWMSLTARKKSEDLLANNINHPNDFGHWIYFEALQSLGL